MEKSKSTINLKVKEIEQSIDFYRCIGFKIPHTETRQFPLRILSEGGNFDLSLIPQDFTSDA
jgi:predicted lactoylglutathione lyase